MRIIEKNGQIFLQGVVCFDLERTLDCGQCFRWKLCPDGFGKGLAAEISAGSNRNVLF